METCMGHAETTQRGQTSTANCTVTTTVITHMNTVFLMVTERLAASALVAKGCSPDI